MKHQSVLLEEVIHGLAIRPDGIYVDGTLGRGGHSLAIARQLTTGRLVCFDKDEQALDESKENLKDELKKITFVHADFRQMKQELQTLGIQQVSGVLLDLGVSSPQFDDASRGFSYRYDAPLDMRMDQSQSLTASVVVNTYPYADLVRILQRYGEEPFAKSIARSIERNRSVKPIETTFELVACIKEALPERILHQKGHPAKQTFQAIRLEVNGELEALQEVLEEATDLLEEKGRLAVITFHSLEDRIVKTYFKSISAAPSVNKRVPLLDWQMEPASFVCITKKPILPSLEELEENNRAHSAKLRIIERREKTHA